MAKGIGAYRIGAIVTAVVSAVTALWFVARSWTAFIVGGASCAGVPVADADPTVGLPAIPDESAVCPLPWGQSLLAIAVLVIGFWFARMLWVAVASDSGAGRRAAAGRTG